MFDLSKLLKDTIDVVFFFELICHILQFVKRWSALNCHRYCAKPLNFDLKPLKIYMLISFFRFCQYLEYNKYRTNNPSISIFLQVKIPIKDLFKFIDLGTGTEKLLCFYGNTQYPVDPLDSCWGLKLDNFPCFSRGNLAT